MAIARGLGVDLPELLGEHEGLTPAQYGEPFEPQPEPLAADEAIVTFEGIVEIFRKGKAITKLTPTKRSGYEEILKTRLIPRFGSTPIVGIGFQGAEALDATMAEEGLSASRRRNVLGTLRSVLRAAVDAKKLAEMPKLPSLPKVGKKVLRALTREQVERLIGWGADGPGVDGNGNLKVTYTWEGAFREYPLTTF